MHDDLNVTITVAINSTRPGHAGRFLQGLSDLMVGFEERGVPVRVVSPDPAPEALADGDPPTADQLDMLPDPEPGPQTVAGPVKRVRDRTAERRAAREKAAQAQPKAAADPDEDELPLEPPGPGPSADPFGDGEDEDEDEPAQIAAPKEPARTEQQCLDGAIVVLRQCFGVTGGGDAVKALQKTYKVPKFIDLPLDQAPALWKDSLVLAKKFNITLPPGI